jgi:hypothetical protein
MKADFPFRPQHRVDLPLNGHLNFHGMMGLSPQTLA